MRQLFYIGDTRTGTPLTGFYQTKGGLLRDYDLVPAAHEMLVELNEEDMVTDHQKEVFDRLYLGRVKR